MSKPKSKRLGRSEREAFYRAVLAERERSGKTYGCVAAERGIPVGTLTWWRGELRRRDARRQGPVVEPGIRFVPVDLSAAAERPAPPEFAVTLPCGAAVRVPADFDAEALAKLLRVLSATC
jgi:hypothetical protein